MTTKYKPYPAYKDSGVEWLGEVPGHWEANRLKFLCNIQTGNKDTVDAVENGDYPFFVRSQQIERINSFTFDCEAVLTAGDGVGVGKVFHYQNGPFDFHQRVYMMNNFRHISGRFFFYYLREMFHKVALDGGAKSTVDSLRLPVFLNFSFTIPPEEEQKVILAYLDRETVKIDTLIAKQERLIELLQEKRTALISHAVTKGLNPDAPMKDSGVEWLREVPAHWKINKLNRLSNQIIDGAHFTPTYVNEGIPFLRVTDIQDHQIDKSMIKYIPENEHKDLIRRCNPKKGDLLLSKNGTVGIPKVIDWDWEFSIFVSLCLIKLKPDLDPYYAYYMFLSDSIKEHINDGIKQSTVINLHLEKISKFIFSVPPIKEQRKIVDFLDHETAKIDTLIQKSRHAIDLLKERRTALISAAVTGKIDVRDNV
ncbi:MAG: restriction endonuclease subunit S [Candidatus Competibacteraceae bacterium]